MNLHHNISSSELRRELIDWLNVDFCCNITRVEQCGQGAMYLQILDRVYPDLVPMEKVNWHSFLELDMENNYRLLQEVLDQTEHTRLLSPRLLVKRKQTDHIELLQWMKNVYDSRIDEFRHLDYNAVERRRLGVGPLQSWASKAVFVRSKPAQLPVLSASHRSPPHQAFDQTASLSRINSPYGLTNEEFSLSFTNTNTNTNPSAPNLLSSNYRDNFDLENMPAQKPDLTPHKIVKQMSLNFPTTLSEQFYENKCKAIEKICLLNHDGELLEKKLIEHVLRSKDFIELQTLAVSTHDQAADKI